MFFRQTIEIYDGGIFVLLTHAFIGCRSDRLPKEKKGAMRAALVLGAASAAVAAGNDAPDMRGLAHESALDCDFESDLCAWTNTGAVPWARISGETPSGEGKTGPGGALEGSAGYYLYTEADDGWEKSAKAAKLFELTVDIGHTFNRRGVSFYYYMSGSHMGTLEFSTSPDGSVFTPLFTFTGETETPGWKPKQLLSTDFPDLLTATHFRFTHRDYIGNRADAAIDIFETLAYMPTKHPIPQPTPLPSVPPTFKPTHIPTSMPTWVPSPVPSLNPSPLPTPEPTLVPSQQPVPNPTPAPTNTPVPTTGTGGPSTKPTPLPTPTPTSEPTPLPTYSLLPTPAPTPLPTLTPTPAPTGICGNGTFFVFPDTCTKCQIGECDARSLLWRVRLCC